jgi:hypothetical protein
VSWLLLVAMVMLEGASQTAPLAKDWLSREQAEKLAVKLAERKPFAASAEAASAEGRKTMGLFFTDREYRVLRGNPVFGYWHAAGFRWVGSRIAWDGVESKGKSCRGITSKAWDVAFRHVARKHGLTLDEKAPLRMRGACVRAVIDSSPEEPVRGVVMEIRMDSPTGAFRWRYSRGNPTIEGAVGASMELPLLLAPKVNQPGWPKD